MKRASEDRGQGPEPAAIIDTLVAPIGGPAPLPLAAPPSVVLADTVNAPALNAARSPLPRHDSKLETMPVPPAGAAPLSVPELLLVGDDERYLLAGEVARGGLGRILRATDQRLRRQVALKELISPHGDAEARFLREALITAKLQHPSIIPLHDAGRWRSGQLFYSMKLVSGSSLDAVIEARPTLAERLALLPHVIDVADAIAYAHSRRIIHRDLKPHNVLVGSFGETVVIDWGLAKDISVAVVDSGRSAPALHLGDEAPDLTLDGAVMGTPAYMPPEQAKGANVDERADVYALGGILYHLLAGVAPYDGATLREVLRKLLVQPPEPPEPLRKIVPGVPRDLEALVEKAMAPVLEDRYRSAEALVADLKKFQTGQIVSAYSYSRRELAQRWLRRNRVAATLLTLLALAGALSVAQIVDRGRLAEQGRRVAETERAKAEELREQAARAEARERTRADEVTLVEARLSLDRDPEESLRYLTQLSPSFPLLGAARTIAADALSRALPRTLRGHTGGIFTSAVSPDGTRLATGSYDKSVRLWDAGTGQGTVLSGHTGGVIRVAFSPDGKRLASASYDKTLRLWDVATGQSVVLAGHTDWLSAMTFSPDGKSLASGSADKTIRIWDLTSGGPPASRTLETRGDFITSLSFSPDGQQLASLDAMGIAHLWDLASSRVRVLDGTGQGPSVLLFSPDGARVAVGAGPGSIHLWDARDGSSRVLHGHDAAVRALTFSRDGKSLASASEDWTVRLWDVASEKSVRLLRGHEASVGCVAFSPDGRRIVSGSDDASVRIWEVDSGGSRILHAHRSQISSVGFLPDGEGILSTSTDATARVWTLSRESGVLPMSPVALSDSTISLDGKRLFVSGNDATLQILDLDTRHIESLTGHTGSVQHVALSPDGKSLASASTDTTIRMWDVEARPARLLQVLRGHAGNVRDVAFSPAGKWLASAGADSTVRLWDLSRTVPIESRVLAGHTGIVLRVVFSPDGKLAASGSDDKTVRLWDATSGAGRVLVGHDSLVQALSFSPDGESLASASLDGTVRIWDIVTGEARVFDGSEGGLYQVRWSPGGDLLATSSDSGVVRLWDVAKGAGRALRGHEGRVLSLAFSPDGLTLASASVDSVLRLWDVVSGENRSLRGHRGEVRRVLFAPSGELLATVGADGAVGLWRDDLPHPRDALFAGIGAALGPASTTP